MRLFSLIFVFNFYCLNIYFRLVCGESGRTATTTASSPPPCNGGNDCSYCSRWCEEFEEVEEKLKCENIKHFCCKRGEKCKIGLFPFSCEKDSGICKYCSESCDDYPDPFEVEECEKSNSECCAEGQNCNLRVSPLTPNAKFNCSDNYCHFCKKDCTNGEQIDPWDLEDCKQSQAECCKEGQYCLTFNLTRSTTSSPRMSTTIFTPKDQMNCWDEGICNWCNKTCKDSNTKERCLESQEECCGEGSYCSIEYFSHPGFSCSSNSQFNLCSYCHLDCSTLETQLDKEMCKQTQKICCSKGKRCKIVERRSLYQEKQDQVGKRSNGERLKVLEWEIKLISTFLSCLNLIKDH